MLTLKHLKMVEAMTQTASLSQTAEFLHISASALSHQVKDFEALIGTAVYQRKVKPLKLSEKGELVASLAAQVLPQIREVQAQLLSTPAIPSSFKIGARCHLCFDWLFASLSSLQQSYPGLEIQLPQANDFDPIPRLLNEELDIVLTSEAMAQKQLSCSALFEFEMRILIAQQHPLTKLDSLQLQDLIDYPVYCFPVDWADIDLYVLLQRQGLSAQRWIRCDSTQSIVQRVASSQGIALLPVWNIARFQELGMVTSRSLQTGAETKQQGFWKTLYCIQRSNAKHEIFPMVKQQLADAPRFFER